MSMVDTVYVMSGGGFFRAAFNGVLRYQHPHGTPLFHMVGFFSAMALFCLYPGP